MLQRLVLNALTDFGVTGQISEPQSSSYDPLTQEYTEATPIITTAKMYYSNFLLESIEDISVITGKKKIAVSPFDVSSNFFLPPKIGSTITGIGKPCVILETQVIYEGSTPIYYICYTEE